MDANAQALKTRRPATTPTPLLRLAEGTAFCGLLLYAVFAPHSIAGAWIALSVATVGWLGRALYSRRLALPPPTPLDLPLWLFYAWSILSALFSYEPRISLLKLVSVSTFLVLYLVRSLTARRTALVVCALMIASGAAGALWSVLEVARGRGLVVEEIAPDSPLRHRSLDVAAGDAVWRVNRRRVNSIAEIEQAFRETPTGAALTLSLFSRGEQVERTGLVVTQELKARAAADGLGLRGTHLSHRFRASGWTRHYQTFAETLQILAQLALGFALADWQRRRARAFPRLRFALCATAFILLAAGIALTAMRTALVAFAVGASVVAWRAAAGRRARVTVALVISVAVLLGAFAVWRTRAEGALRLRDDSSRLRFEVARVALARTPARPLFGHGMDAVKAHWTEWGFPGNVQIHTHSTPLQLVFERGFPALILWLWLLAAFWLVLARGERRLRVSPDAPAHGLLLGATGALAGFFASSLVNYNFGDAEVALVLWWLMGTTLAVIGRPSNVGDRPEQS